MAKVQVLSIVGNIFWFLLFGWWLGLLWLVLGLLWCITVLGIPIGLQCFKLCVMGFVPFGKEITYDRGDSRKVNTTGIALNIIWVVFGGWLLALAYLAAGIVCCCTIIGVPFGLQCFKMLVLSFSPFGAQILSKE